MRWPHTAVIVRPGEQTGLQDPVTGVFIPGVPASTELYNGPADMQHKRRTLGYDTERGVTKVADAVVYLLDEVLVWQLKEGFLITVLDLDRNVILHGVLSAIEELSGLVWVSQLEPQGQGAEVPA